MRKSKGARAIETLAKEKGISVEEVRNEIQIAIDMGMANRDPEVQAYWRKIPYKGNKPTPEEVIAYIAKQVKKDIY